MAAGKKKLLGTLPPPSGLELEQPILRTKFDFQAVASFFRISH